MMSVIEKDALDQVKADTEKIIKAIDGVADSVTTMEFIPIEKLENLFGNTIYVYRMPRKGHDEQYFTYITDSFPTWDQFEKTNPVTVVEINGPVSISSFRIRGMGLNMRADSGRSYVRLTMDDVITGFMVSGSGQGYNNWGGPAISFSSSNAGNKSDKSDTWPNGELYASNYSVGSSSVLREVKTTKPIYCKKIFKLEYALVKLSSLTENYGSGVEMNITYNVLGEQ